MENNLRAPLFKNYKLEKFNQIFYPLIILQNLILIKYRESILDHFHKSQCDIA